MAHGPREGQPASKGVRNDTQQEPHQPALPGSATVGHGRRRRVRPPQRIARRAKNIAIGRALGPAGVWRRLWR
jgi:hypothetical protein